jgi:hypothetical protein
MKKLLTLQKVVTWLLIAFIFLTNCNESDSTVRIDSIGTELLTEVYKTKGDYFNYVNTWGKKNAPSSLSLADSNQISVVGTDTVYKLRWVLEDNYVMGLAISSKDYFTDMTFAEIVTFNEKYPEKLNYPIDEIFKRVIDKDPFLEFYVDENNIFYHRDSNDIQQINQLIKDGKLEKYFKKIK